MKRKMFHVDVYLREKESRCNIQKGALYKKIPLNLWKNQKYSRMRSKIYKFWWIKWKDKGEAA